MMGKNEVPYYIGLIFGMIVGSLGMRALGFANNIVVLLGALVVGVGCGFAADLMHKKSKGP